MYQDSVFLCLLDLKRQSINHFIKIAFYKAVSRHFIFFLPAISLKSRTSQTTEISLAQSCG